MTFSTSPVNGALRVGVAKQLWGTEFDLFLDGITNGIYYSPMKQVAENETAVPSTEDTNGAAAATLFSFLDVADSLYTRIAEALKAAGLSYAKYDVLHQLRKAKEPVSLRILAEQQGCAASNITQLVDRLEAEGLVQRIDDPDDRRSVRAQLTEQGAVQADEGATQIDVVRAQFAASFTAAERVQLGRLLAKIR
ncbi:MAG: MarR family transcriptional regulator [Gemmatimonadota bacterium]